MDKLKNNLTNIEVIIVTFISGGFVGWAISSFPHNHQIYGFAMFILFGLGIGVITPHIVSFMHESRSNALQRNS